MKCHATKNANPNLFKIFLRDCLVFFHYSYDILCIQERRKKNMNNFCFYAIRYSESMDYIFIHKCIVVKIFNLTENFQSTALATTQTPLSINFLMLSIKKQNIIPQFWYEHFAPFFMLTFLFPCSFRFRKFNFIYRSLEHSCRQRQRHMYNHIHILEISY